MRLFVSRPWIRTPGGVAPGLCTRLVKLDHAMVFAIFWGKWNQLFQSDNLFDANSSTFVYQCVGTYPHTVIGGD